MSRDVLSPPYDRSLFSRFEEVQDLYHACDEVRDRLEAIWAEMSPSTSLASLEIKEALDRAGKALVAVRYTK